MYMTTTQNNTQTITQIGIKVPVRNFPNIRSMLLS